MKLSLNSSLLAASLAFVLFASSPALACDKPDCACQKANHVSSATSSKDNVQKSESSDAAAARARLNLASIKTPKISPEKTKTFGSHGRTAMSRKNILRAD